MNELFTASERWVVKYHPLDHSVTIESDCGPTLEAKGATLAQADEIAEALNLYYSDRFDEPVNCMKGASGVAQYSAYTVTKRFGGTEVAYSAPAAEEVMWMAEQGADRVEGSQDIVGLGSKGLADEADPEAAFVNWAWETAKENVRRAEQQGISVERLHKIVAGALFDFVGMLTCSPKTYTFSAGHIAGAVDAVEKFAETRFLSLTNADVERWQDYLEVK